MRVYSFTRVSSQDFQCGVRRDSIHRGDGRREKGIPPLHPVATSNRNMLVVVGINHAGLPVHSNFMQQTLDFQRGVGRDSIYRVVGRRDKGIPQLDPAVISSGNMLGVVGINHAGLPVHPNFMQQTQDFQHGVGGQYSSW